MKLEFELTLEDFRDIARMAAVAVTAAALYHELQKPPHLRTWHGEVGGVVPYDFRAPTLEGLRESCWNPDNPSLFTQIAFGVGWGLNFATLTRNVQRLAQDALVEVRLRLEAPR